MLQQLVIKNIAIIDDLTIDFQNGLNVITGETGAGKSIIINGISLLVGNRANSSLIRSGCSKAYVEGLFTLNQKNLDRLKDYDIEGNQLIISKDIYADGRTITKINGRNISLATLKEICASIINIHSQFDNQYLFNSDYHQHLLNSFAKDSLDYDLKIYQKKYNEYLEMKEKYNQLLNNDYNQDDLEFLEYRVKEIKDLDLKENEIEELEIEQKRIANYSKINDKVQEAIALLDNERGAIDTLYGAKKALEALNDDPLFAKYSNSLNDIYLNTSELISNIKHDFQSLDIDPYRLEEISLRISDINKIKKKYGASYQEINDKLKEFEEKINQINNKELLLSQYEKELLDIEKDLEVLALKLSTIRQKKAKELSLLVIKELKDLYLDSVTIEFRFSRTGFQEDGFDKVEIFISFNKGEELKPLIKVSSGGEISRVMLGLKSIFNRLLGLEVIIFDEVDSGISGRVANSVANKMKEMSKEMQVIVITHLPNVAAMADYHYLVAKQTIGEKTFTSIKLLNELEREIEIAKMIFGDNYQEKELQSVKEMLIKK